MDVVIKEDRIFTWWLSKMGKPLMILMFSPGFNSGTIFFWSSEYKLCWTVAPSKESIYVLYCQQITALIIRCACSIPMSLLHQQMNPIQSIPRQIHDRVVQNRVSRHQLIPQMLHPLRKLLIPNQIHHRLFLVVPFWIELSKWANLYSRCPIH